MRNRHAGPIGFLVWAYFALIAFGAVSAMIVAILNFGSGRFAVADLAEASALTVAALAVYSYATGTRPIDRVVWRTAFYGACLYFALSVLVAFVASYWSERPLTFAPDGPLVALATVFVSLPLLVILFRLAQPDSVTGHDLAHYT